MALTNANNYSFNSHQGVLDFISPLILEGYPVAIQTVYEENYWDKGRIDHYEVSVGEKKKPIKIYVGEPEKAENDDIDILRYKRPLEQREIIQAFWGGKTLQYRPIKFDVCDDWKDFSENTAGEDYSFDFKNYEYRIKKD